MKLTLVVSIILILLFIYRIGEMKKGVLSRKIYIIIFIGIIIINGLILHDYVKVKSLHNYSTYITYENLLNRINDVAEFEIEDASDIMEFRDRVDRLNWQLSLLGQQLDRASLIKGQKNKTISNINSISLELEAFVNYQNGILAREDEIVEMDISTYDEFKIKITELCDILEVKESKLSGNLMGIVQFRLKPEKGQLNQLDSILESISEINARIMKL